MDGNSSARCCMPIHNNSIGVCICWCLVVPGRPSPTYSDGAVAILAIVSLKSWNTGIPACLASTIPPPSPSTVIIVRLKVIPHLHINVTCCSTVSPPPTPLLLPSSSSSSFRHSHCQCAHHMPCIFLKHGSHTMDGLRDRRWGTGCIAPKCECLLYDPASPGCATW